MRFDGGRESQNIEDRRGQGFSGRGIKIGGAGVLIAIVVGYLTGTNPLQLLNMMSQGGGVPYSESEEAPSAEESPTAEDAPAAETTEEAPANG